MATTTYEPIQSQTLGSASATVTFLNIPQGYTDLVLIASRQFSNVSTGNQNTLITFNNDTGANYSTTYFVNGPGTGRINSANSLYTSSGGNETAQRYSTDVWNFFNYSNTNIYKTSLLDHNFGASMKQLWTGVWRSTAAITRIDITGSGSATFAAGSIFTLYGIADASVATGVKATGGIITYDDTYYYHTFGASGTFTPKQSLTAEYLVIAGGGGTGSDNGSGAGAGGVRSTTASLTAQNYTVTVGAGGAGGASPNANGVKGNDSTFNSFTSTGGGLGAGGNLAPANQDGGSGGGATGNYTGGNTTPAYYGGISSPVTSPVQGYAGGNSYNTTAVGFSRFSGGGGGAGGAGGNAGAYFAGNGGVGTSAYSAWGSATGTGQNVGGTYYYGGGGGGSAYDNTRTAGSAGYGGGGQGGVVYGSGPFNGTANTGGGAGGGGGSGSVAGGAGGSGIVIIRYTKA